jgi:hypothetical protein
MILNTIKIFHVIYTFIFILFPLFVTTYDVEYMLYLSAIAVHWAILKDECLISYIEKKVINNKYVLGENGDLPFLSLINYENLPIIKFILFFSIFNIMYRNMFTKDRNAIIFLFLYTLGLRQIKWN